MGLALESFPYWPAAMNRETALAYTQVSETQMREWEQRGLVRFRNRGRNGAAIALRSDLDAALLTLVDHRDGPGDVIEFD